MPKPQRDNPEWRVAVAIKKEMENAGFRGYFVGKKVFNGRMWVSAVPKNLPDWYYHHPDRKLSVWVETKAPGEQPTPGQAQFIEDHRGSETQAVYWDDVAECVAWLEREGLRFIEPGTLRPLYPAGIHNPVVASGPIDFEDM